MASLAPQKDVTLNRVKLKVAEIFGPTIQGEGPAVGQPCYFIRIGGCDFRCRWCDSMHAVAPELVKKLPFKSVDQILDELAELPGNFTNVIISGGNPCIYGKPMDDLLHRLTIAGFDVHVETQGSLFREWLGMAHTVVMSPKPESSGMLNDKMMVKYQRFYKNCETRGINVNLKIVVFNQSDLEWAFETAKLLEAKELFISIGTDASDTRDELIARYEWIISMVLEHSLSEQFKISVLPQMHVILWGHKLGV